MTDAYSAEALGQVIRQLREMRQPAMSQDELGRRANYGAGRGVSISRIEAGVNRPNSQRFRDIARALDVDPEQLAHLARARTDVHREHRSDRSRESARRRGTPERLQALQQTVKARTDVIESSATAFNEAHEQARRDFLVPFLAASGRITGASVSSALEDEISRSAAEPQTVADSETPPGSEPPERAAAKVGPAARRGGMLAAGVGTSSGKLLLIAVIASPISMLAAGGLLFLARRRSKREDEELTSQLDDSEASLQATQRGFDALVEVIPRATGLLEYIAVHGGHALDRWLQTIGTSPVAWVDLTSAQQQHYQDFITVAECQLSLNGIDTSSFLTSEGDALQRVIADTNDLLQGADRAIRDLV